MYGNYLSGDLVSDTAAILAFNAVNAALINKTIVSASQIFNAGRAGGPTYRKLHLSVNTCTSSVIN